jgi:KipI family sensor histidine kinase inhibitor
VIRVGESAFLLELGSTAEVLAARRLVAAELGRGLRELVPGASTLLVVAERDRALDARRLGELERAARQASESGAATRLHTIAVRYDGPDLAAVAAHAGIAVDQVAALHGAAEYRVAFVGFQPGFAYLAGLPATLHAPRRPSPRPRVPAGSVAIGGPWTGVYPLGTPGGWNLIGTSDALLFDAARDRPALLEPGDAVRFVVR